MIKGAAVMLLALGIVGQVSAHERDFLARFAGGMRATLVLSTLNFRTSIPKTATWQLVSGVESDR
jgi:hypothetical protein